MAKIYNLELKAIKTIEGLKGHGFSASLYYMNKKVATCIDNAEADEACLNVIFENKVKGTELEKEIKDVCTQYFKDYPKELIDSNLVELIYELYELKSIEDVYKKAIKKGFVAVIELRSFKRVNCISDFNKEPEVYSCKKWDEEFKQLILNKFKPIEYTVYQDLEDFIIMK